MNALDRAAIPSLGHVATARVPEAGKRDEKVWQTCCQFEALFINRLLSEMRKSSSAGSEQKSFAGDVHYAMLDQAIAESTGKQGLLGIATTLYRQMEQNHFTHPAGETPIHGNGAPADIARGESPRLRMQE